MPVALATQLAQDEILPVRVTEAGAAKEAVDRVVVEVELIGGTAEVAAFSFGSGFVLIGERHGQDRVALEFSGTCDHDRRDQRRGSERKAACREGGVGRCLL
jgi:hypothetical protein